MTDKAYAVPLHELLVGVPRDTRLEIIDPDGMGTRFIPVGRYCHEAAEALRARLAEREWVGLTDDERREIISDTERDDRGYVMALVEAKLKEKNGY